MRIEVVPYHSTWPATFQTIRSELAEALDSVEVVGIEHVGSSAMPGLAAKPVIDVDVVVAGDQVDAAIEALGTVGYVHRGGMGVPDRHSLAVPDRGPRRHVHVVVDGSLALRNHLGVRDVLRADRDLRERYDNRCSMRVRPTAWRESWPARRPDCWYLLYSLKINRPGNTSAISDAVPYRHFMRYGASRLVSRNT